MVVTFLDQFLTKLLFVVLWGFLVVFFSKLGGFSTKIKEVVHP